MEKKLSYLKKGACIFGIFALIFFIKVNTTFAAQQENEQNGITELKKDTVYTYDLNGDGTKENIIYKVSTNDDKYTVTLKLYINDKLTLTKTSHGFAYTLDLCDLDKSDNYLDLYGYSTMESDGIDYSFFAQYDGNDLINLTRFQPSKIYKDFNAYRYSLGVINGDGTFTAVIDTPVFSDAIGCYLCSLPFQLKDQAITKVSAKTYDLNKYSSEYKYKAKKSFSVYDKVGSKKVSFVVNKGDKVTFDKMYVSKSGKVYFRMINSKGTKGWIKSTQKNLFSNLPMWG